LRFSPRALGRNGETLLAHITPAEARLLDAVTDGGSINPQPGRKRPCWNFGAASKKGLPMEGPFALKNG